jgi:parallel beta-helix repeat protein
MSRTELTISAAGPFAGTVFNVKDHGAAGDGSTDDTDKLQAAIAASREGDAIYFPPGTYLVTGPLAPKARQLYFSLTDAATIKVKRVRGGKPFTVFEVESGPVEFRHLTLDLSKPEGTQPPRCAENAPPAILARAAAGGTVDVVVSSCRVRHAHGHGIRVGGSGDELLRDRVIVRDTVVEDCCESGLVLGRVNGGRVEACRFERCRTGLVAGFSRDVVISAVTATDNRRHGIVFRFSRDWHVHDCLATRNGGRERDETKQRGWGIAAGGGPEEGTPNSDFTITDNICADNYAGGITLDPTFADDPDTTGEEESALIWAQRARVSGNVCRGRRGGRRMPGESPFGVHGVHVRNSSDVVVTDNVCHDNQHSGIQIVNCSHVLVQTNASYDNGNGIGLFSRDDLEDPAGPAGGLVIGVNMLYRNDHDLRQGDFGTSPRAFPALRLYGLHGSERPECNLRANPGTLFEWHGDREGALYLKQRGNGTEGWVEATTQPEGKCPPSTKKPPRPPGPP